MNKGFNVIQGEALLLLKPLNLPVNLVLKLIIFISTLRTIFVTNQKNPSFKQKIHNEYLIGDYALNLFSIAGSLREISRMNRITDVCENI